MGIEGEPVQGEMFNAEGKPQDCDTETPGPTDALKLPEDEIGDGYHEERQAARVAKDAHSRAVQRRAGQRAADAQERIDGRPAPRDRTSNRSRDELADLGLGVGVPEGDLESYSAFMRAVKLQREGRDQNQN